MAKMAPPPPPKFILSDDILLQILSRLPLHHLLRFKKVSTSFSKLASEAYWLRRQTMSSSSSSASSSSASPALIVQDYCYVNKVVHLDSGCRDDAAATVIADGAELLPPSKCLTSLLLATCNGLLLYHDQAEEAYCVSNPVTQQWLRLPPTTQKGPNLVAGIDFDPRISPPHFKVAQFVCCPRAPLHLSVFDSRTRTRREVRIGLPVEVELLRRRDSSVLVDDVVYAFSSLTKILRVDVRARSCLPVSLPVRWTDESGDTARMTLHKCEGRVRFAYHQQNEFEQIRMWVMGDAAGHETGTRWVPLFKCTYRFLDERLRDQLPGHRLVSVLDIAPSSDVVVLSARTGTDTATYTVLVPYCFRTKTVLRMSSLKVFPKRLFAF